MDIAEEQELLRRARAGDAKAFGALVDAHQGAVRAFVRRLTGHVADAEDVAQEAFVMAFHKLGRMREGVRLKAFVGGIAYRLWLQNRRAWFRRRLRDGAYRALQDDDSDPRSTLFAHHLVRQAMDALPPQQRAALALCIGADYTHAEAAEALKLPLGTVKSHVARGLAKLRTTLGVDPLKEVAAHDA